MTWDEAVCANLRAMEAVLRRPHPRTITSTPDAALETAMREELAFTEQAAQVNAHMVVRSSTAPVSARLVKVRLGKGALQVVGVVTSPTK